MAGRGIECEKQAAGCCPGAVRVPAQAGAGQKKACWLSHQQARGRRERLTVVFDPPYLGRVNAPFVDAVNELYSEAIDVNYAAVSVINKLAEIWPGSGEKPGRPVVIVFIDHLGYCIISLHAAPVIDIYTTMRNSSPKVLVVLLLRIVG